MEQSELFQADAELYAAIAADITAGGGNKTVGALLWPDKDPEKARTLASHAANPGQKQQLTYKQMQLLKRIAWKKVGKSQIHALESKRLMCDLHWTTKEERVERVQSRMTDAWEQLQNTLRESKELLAELEEARAGR